MSLTIRNADADRMVRLGDVLDALHAFRHEILQSFSGSTLLDSSDWEGQGYRPATPEEVVANVQDAVLEEMDYLTQNLLSELGA